MISIVTLTKKLVAFQTVTDNGDSLVSAFKFIQEFFNNSGSEFDTRILNQKKTKAIVVLPSGINRPDILLVGHMDVVAADKKLFVPRVVGDKIIGRGSFDMKGPIAAMMMALIEYVQKNPKASVGLLITSDEERGGFEGMGQLIKQKRFQPKIAIVPDGGSDFVCVKGGKGVCTVKITAKGISAHASRPWEGKNAIMNMARILVELERKYPGWRESKTMETTFAPTNLKMEKLGGNVVPNEVEVVCDVRQVENFDFPEFKKFVERKFRAIVEVRKYAQPYDAHLAKPLARQFLRVMKKHLRKNPVKMMYPSTCDARFFAQIGIPVIVTRPAGGGAHGDGEWISIRGLERFKEILADYLQSYNN